MNLLVGFRGQGLGFKGLGPIVWGLGSGSKGLKVEGRRGLGISGTVSVGFSFGLVGFVWGE